MAQFKNSQEFLDKLNQWFNALIAPPLLFMGYGYLEIYSGRVSGFTRANDLVTGVTTLIIVTGMVMLSIRFKREVRIVGDLKSLKDQLEQYLIRAKKYYLQVFALSSLCVLFLFSFGRLEFSAAYAFILFTLSLFKPTLISLAKTFRLKDEVKAAFIKKESLIYE